MHHDDVIKWKHFPRDWPVVKGIHRSPVNSPHKAQWRRALMFSLIYAWTNGCVKPRSHIACNRSTTSLRPKLRVVAGRLQGGCKEVGDWSPTGCRDDLVAMRFWLLQVKLLCDQIDRRKVFGGRQQVADWSPTGGRLIADQLQRLQTIPTRFLVADWSPTDLQKVADFLQSKTNAQDTVANQSPTDRQSVADRSPTDRRLHIIRNPMRKIPVASCS